MPLRPFLPSVKQSVPQRVLLVRDDVIGDLVVQTSAVSKWLLEHDYDVYLVIRENLIDIGKLFLSADRLIPLNIKLYRSSVRYRFNFLKQIRKIGFGIAIGSIIHSSVNDDIVRSSGAKLRYGYKRNNTFKENLKLRGMKKVHSLNNIDTVAKEYTHVLEHEKHFIETIFQININPDKSFFPAAKITPAKLSFEAPRYIHYLAEAGAVKRVFPPERLLPILFSIARKAGLKIVLTGLNKIPCDNELCINLTGKTTLAEVISIVNNADFVIGNESGLSHLAWIIGKKTAIFYGGGHWGRFKPPIGTLLLNNYCEYRCCDWKCRYDTIPVPCVNIDDGLLQKQLENFIFGLAGR